MENTEPLKSSTENDGLYIEIDEETDQISFTWNPETHPQWNIIEDLGKEKLREILLKAFNVACESAQPQEETNGVGK